jgi:hypothetical protein
LGGAAAVHEITPAHELSDGAQLYLAARDNSTVAPKDPE